jgi:hypothetical protein
MQYYAQVKQKGFFPDTSKLGVYAKQLQDLKNVNISREQYEIGEATVQKAAKGLPVSQDTLTASFRALSPYITPDVLKRMGVSGSTRAGELAQIMNTKKDPLTGKTYDQTVSPGMIAMSQLAATEGSGGREANVIREIQEFVESGMMKKQALAWQNPVFRAQAEALAIKYQNQGMDEVAARGRSVLEAATLAQPTEALNIASQTVQAGLGALQQSILSAKTGILSLNAPMLRTKGPDGKDYGYGYGLAAAAGLTSIGDKGFDAKSLDVTNKYRQTAQFKESAYGYHWQEIQDHYKKEWAKFQETAHTQDVVNAKKKEFAEQQALSEEQLLQRYQTIHSPMDMITAELGAFLLKLGLMFGKADNQFIKPVVAIMSKIGKYFAQLDKMIDDLGDQLAAHKITLPEAIGKLLGNIIKALADAFNPKNMKGAQGAFQQVINEFVKGFKEAGGDKAAKQLMDTLKDVLMHVLFKDGNVMKGTTPVANFLIVLFAALSAPAVISAVIMGVTPLIIHGMGTLFIALFKKLGTLTVSELGKTAKLGAHLPLVGAVPKVAKAAKMGVVSAGAAAIVSIATHAPGLLKVGKALGGAGKVLTQVGKKVPVLSVALAGVDFAARKQAGERTSKAAGGAVGGVIGTAAGGFLGSFLDPFIGPFGTMLGGMAGGALGDMVGSKVGPFFADLPKNLSKYMEGFKQWFADLPRNLGFIVGQSVVRLQKAFSSFKKWFNDLGPSLSTDLNRAGWAIKGAWVKFQKEVAKIFSGKMDWGAALHALETGISGMFNGLMSWIHGFTGRFMQGFRAGEVNERSGGAVPRGKPKKAGSKAFGEPGVNFGSLSGAIGYEMANKPSGSDLVIANSSETIIPAAKGYGKGVEDIIDTTKLTSDNVSKKATEGFNTLSKENKIQTETNAKGFEAMVTTTLATSKQLKDSMTKGYSAIMEAVQGMMNASGGGDGGGGGGPAGFGGSKQTASSLVKLAQQAGFKGNQAAVMAAIAMAESGGNSGAHNTNAGTGDNSYGLWQINMLGSMGPERRRQFGIGSNDALFNPGTNAAAAMSMYRSQGLGAWSTYKNGAYRQYLGTTEAAMHAAYALGSGRPAFFRSQREAEAWEKSMVGPGVRVGSITGNSREGFGGGPISVNAPITIHQQPHQDAEELASIVALRIGEAVAEARAASINM